MKRFNYTGTCIPEKHYMVDISNKIHKIANLIEDGLYFTINRPRQFGKTTTIYRLEERLKKDYILISTSFEGTGDTFFETEKTFCESIFEKLANAVVTNDEEFKRSLQNEIKKHTTFEEFSNAITHIIKQSNKKVILFIDEVDKASNFTIFLNFIGMLRNKYLSALKNQDYTFHSVILAGLHDIKNIKLKMRHESTSKFNSPWNIAIDFDIDMSFSSEEIASMLVDYETENNIGMDIKKISEKLYEFTSGYPYLVSKLCFIIDSKLNKDFTENGIIEAVKIILDESSNSLFDDIIKNIENNEELYNLIKTIVLGYRKIPFSHTEPLISIATMYGILKNNKKTAVIHNIIFEILLYDHFVIKAIIERATSQSSDYITNFIDKNNDVDMKMVLVKFQELMKTEYRDKDDKFVEREGRLIFLAFIKPIINGVGFYFVEPQTRMDNRMDVVVTFNQKKYIIELKIWRGEKYRQEGLEQLAKYLDSQDEKNGYLIQFSFNKEKKYTNQSYNFDGKEIFEVVV